MRARRRMTAGCVASLIGLGACGRGSAPAFPARADAARLEGIWAATFVLDEPPLGFDSTALRRAPHGRVGGTLAFVPNHWLSTASAAGARLPAPPTLYGTYDVDFTAFGFDPRDAERVPDVVGTTSPSAAAAGRDSVVLVLGPTGDGARVVLAGTTHDDSVVGTWRLEGAGRAAASATGHFVLVGSPAVPAHPAVRAALGAGLGLRARAALHGVAGRAPGRDR